MTQIDSAVETVTHGESVAITQKNIDITGKVNPSANEQLRIPHPDGMYTMSVKYDDGPYDVVSIFRKATNIVQISVGIS